jgi:DNA-binding MarR family transcriptional regulator
MDERIEKGADEGASDPLAFRLMNEIGIIAQISGNMLERALPGEMKMSHFVVLNHFVRLGGERTPQELARAFQVSKSAMTNTIQRLEAQEFVSVSPDSQDQRVKRVRLTQAGARAREEAVSAVAPLLEAMNSAIGMADMQACLPVLQQLRVWIGTQRDD